MRVAIVGCGKMAQALLSRWLATGTLQPADVRACTRRPETAAAVAAAHGVLAGSDARQAVADANAVVLGIKPQQLPEFSLDLSGRVLVSLLAGVTTAHLEAKFPGARVVRTMPNTPVRVGLGLVGLVAGKSADDEALSLARTLLAPAGHVMELAETQMDAFTAVAGCGPAYVFLFLEALTHAAEVVGLDPDQAKGMAQQVMTGALALAEQDGRPAAQLRAEVTSKGGMTEAALTVLAERGWSHALAEAVQAAQQRGTQLAQMR